MHSLATPLDVPEISDFISFWVCNPATSNCTPIHNYFHRLHKEIAPGYYQNELPPMNSGSSYRIPGPASISIIYAL